ncbi:SpvB/TcaC N-terminal domain-containing protein [Sporocytophaga myxococcoides]|uniref:SpvB/TcaC N-terminal domain-containing protein n=1 Tax=Sporocytophaga myxococcoides TaxID=153721 RepID=UPI0004252934|nr:SpvB/TcaC N-terminal domain-containing protein [Sporocytophaga myxococcoides]
MKNSFFNNGAGITATLPMDSTNESQSKEGKDNMQINVPVISMPKGGGAIKGIDEKFSVNAVNGTMSLSIPLPFATARGVSPQLQLSYNSGSGNGIFGLGWSFGLPSIKRKTDKYLPQYFDEKDSDTFLFSEAEDLVPAFKKGIDGKFVKKSDGCYEIDDKDSEDHLYTIRTYLPRIEGNFARIERWCEKHTSKITWRVTTKENVTTLFGWSSNSKIFDPKDPHKIFEWLPEFIFDDKGNCAHYIYQKENDVGLDISYVHNKNRHDKEKITYTNLYLSKILYGNKTPYKSFGDAYPLDSDYLFSTILDYGEYSDDTYEPVNEWTFRKDAFSNYKAGFEIRTTRVCKRVLLFHHFKGNGEYDGLVRSLNFEYDNDAPEDFTFLKSITSTGHIKKPDGSYSEKSLPPMEFQYEKHQWNDQIKTISRENLMNAPAGVDDQNYQFTDLYGEGLPGILTEQASAWYYKSNLGNGRFAQAELVSPKPSFQGLANKLQLADLDADGKKQLVSFEAETRGYFEINDDATWKPFRYFKGFPNIDIHSPDVRMLDLNGDGKPDLLVSEDDIFTWYPSEGRDGYSVALRNLKSKNEEDGPAVIFADNAQTIFLADMTGDGLTDIVRIRNGEVCYWANLGYGNFSAKITMDQSPFFDREEAFTPSLIRLADIDGSGTTDIIYLGKNKFTCWKNLSGNRFSETPFEISSFPPVNLQTKVSAMDLLGNGLSCIVWSSAHEEGLQAPLRFIDLMNSKKPHIITCFKNNLGKEVHLEYIPSTKYYLQDKSEGKTWATKIPFPIHCISKTITKDKISGASFVSQYRYHHGYYDRAEKEFRGFGMVEQVDTETFDHWVKGNASNIVEEPLHQEPVISKSWFHTGAFVNKSGILDQFKEDYWYSEIKRQRYEVPHHESDLNDARIISTTGTDVLTQESLSEQEWREALRSCKGMGLRSEVFANDAAKYGNTVKAKQKALTPFSVATHNCFIEMLQPKGQNKHAVFVVKESEAITYCYERNPEDPRISHTLNIQFDDYGNVLESASVVYPRKIADNNLPKETRDEQGKTNIVYLKKDFTNDIITQETYRLRMPGESQTFELKNVKKTGQYYTLEDFSDILLPQKSETIQYHEHDKPPLPGKAQKRLIEHVRSTYYRDAMDKALPLYKMDSKGISYANYQLAYTPELLQDIYQGRVQNSHMTEGKFIQFEDDPNWWIGSGTVNFIANSETQTDAQNRFYVPTSYKDSFDAVTKVKYDNYFLHVIETEDALGSKSNIEKFNYRTLAPSLVKDINDNLTEVITDELGMVKAIAVKGKGDEADDLAGLSDITDKTEALAIQSFLQENDSTQLTIKAKSLLKKATMRFVYDLDAFRIDKKPVVVAGIMREVYSDSESPVQLSFEYSNGISEVIMKKVQAEPGIAKRVTINENNTYVIDEVNTADDNHLRWIGNGRTIRNNKGNAVKQYEPYFSVSQHYEDQKELVETGMTALIYYDAPGRLIKTIMPDDTFSKIEFNTWEQAAYDTNDNILDSLWYQKRINGSLDAELIKEGKDPAKEKEAAQNAAKHANTPSLVHTDAFGRGILFIQHLKNVDTNKDEYLPSKMTLDIEGNQIKVTDPRENTVIQYKYDMLGHKVYQESMDAGKRWLLSNVLNHPLRTWDERNHEFQYFYDKLKRPVKSIISGGDGLIPLDNIVYDYIVYGEDQLLSDRSNETELKNKNCLGRAVLHFDTGGLLSISAFDFNGQPINTTRKLFKKYKEVPDWQGKNLEDDLDEKSFTFTIKRDALGRITSETAPDLSVVTFFYNEGSLLNSQYVKLPGEAESKPYIKDIDYNEKGQKSKVIYGNDVFTKFFYDKETFRLKQLECRPKNSDPIQDWRYTYDAVGNITHIEDKKAPIIFFNNQIVESLSEYTYDSLYRLVGATGRENDSQMIFDTGDNWNDASFMNQLNPGGPMAMRNYNQSYRYDRAGNISEMIHSAGTSWTRQYEYEDKCNRLKKTSIGNIDYKYVHHPQHGYIESMPHLSGMSWNFKEELVKTIKQRKNDGTPETTYYQYDGKGKRIRKITEMQAPANVEAVIKDERIYIVNYELYKIHSGTKAGLERTTLSLMNDNHRFVMIDRETASGTILTRYQLDNHLGSVGLELDEKAQVISYEEYHPFGTTAYQAKNAAINAAAKRYRYTAMERDEETGFEYHTSRYYLPWLGRWLSPDPIGTGDGLNIYTYVLNKPVHSVDTNGRANAPIHRDLTTIIAMQYVSKETAIKVGEAANLPDTKQEYDSTSNSKAGDPKGINKNIHVLDKRSTEEKVTDSLNNYRTGNVIGKETDPIKNAGVNLLHPIQDAHYHLPNHTFGVGGGHSLEAEIDLAVGKKSFEEFYQVVLDTEKGLALMKEKGVFGKEEKATIAKLTKEDWKGIYDNLKAIEEKNDVKNVWYKIRMGASLVFAVGGIVTLMAANSTGLKVLGAILALYGAFGDLFANIGGHIGQFIGEVVYGSIKGGESGRIRGQAYGVAIGGNVLGLGLGIVKDLGRDEIADQESGSLRSRYGFEDKPGILNDTNRYTQRRYF